MLFYFWIEILEICKNLNFYDLTMQMKIYWKKYAENFTYATILHDFTFPGIKWMIQSFSELDMQCLQRLDINPHIWDIAHKYGNIVHEIKQIYF